MNPEAEVEDRLFDCLLEEAAGREPAADLLQRTLTALAEGPRISRGSAPTAASEPGSPRRSPRWLLAAVAMLAVSVVALIAYRNGSDHPGDTDPVPRDERDDQDRQQDQDKVRTPPETLVQHLGDTDKAEQAARDLQRLGRKAVPALIAALADERAARGKALGVLESIGPEAAPALQPIARLLDSLPSGAPLYGPAFRTAAVLAPFASEEARAAAEQSLLLIAFIKGGPAAGPVAARGGPGAPGPAAPRRPTYSIRDLARFLHRSRLTGDASSQSRLSALASESPYERELAASLLGTGPATEPAIRGLREALAAEHPTRVAVTWASQGFSGNFEFNDDRTEAIRLAAARSLVRLAGHEPRSAPAQAWLLGHGSPGEQRTAALTLARTRPLDDDRDAVRAALHAALDRTGDEIDPLVLRECVTAAGVGGFSDPETVARLRKLSGHGDPQVAARARATLRSLER